MDGRRRPPLPVRRGAEVVLQDIIPPASRGQVLRDGQGSQNLPRHCPDPLSASCKRKGLCTERHRYHSQRRSSRYHPSLRWRGIHVRYQHRDDVFIRRHRYVLQSNDGNGFFSITGRNIIGSPFQSVLPPRSVHAPARGFESSKTTSVWVGSLLIPISRFHLAAILFPRCLSRIALRSRPGLTTSSSIPAPPLPMASSLTMASRQTSSRLPSFQSLRRLLWL